VKLGGLLRQQMNLNKKKSTKEYPAGSTWVGGDALSILLQKK
jgi:hypothetical protein